MTRISTRLRAQVRRWVRIRLTCGRHQILLSEFDASVMSKSELIAVSRSGDPVAYIVRSIVFGCLGAIDIVRREPQVCLSREGRHILYLSLRTGFDYRDVTSLRRSPVGQGVGYLREIVARPRRSEYRDWNNCYVGSRQVNDKYLFNRIVGQAQLPVPHQFRVYKLPAFFDADDGGRIVFCGADIPVGEWMLKTRLGMQGEQVWRCRSLAVSASSISFNSRMQSVPADLTESLARGELIAEEWLSPDSAFAECGDTALPTIRVVTLALSRITVITKVLFRGALGSHVSNWRRGGLVYEIREDGTCGTGYDHSGLAHGECPVSLTAELLTKVDHMCIAAHQCFPCVGSVGWDVGLSANGPVLLEGNANWGMGIPQLFPGLPLLRTFQDHCSHERWGP